MNESTSPQVFADLSPDHLLDAIEARDPIAARRVLETMLTYSESAIVAEIERLEAEGRIGPQTRAAPPRRERHKLAAGGTEYELLLGDCHRHTDIRGHSGVDGSIHRAGGPAILSAPSRSCSTASARRPRSRAEA